MSESFNHPTGEKPPIPRLQLEEGPDYIDASELYQRIADTLVELDYDPQTVLLCGHNQDNNEGTPRMSTFAMSFSEIDRELASPLHDTPYDYAREVAGWGETPTITAYNGQLLRLSMEHGGQYETVEGSPVETATILEVELKTL